ncbi:MAG TPA: hypothetical protein VFK38_02480, partial [Candidatus Limnocylindrales bacterium]|nr:hypothetical protein [Candidatus Limnocylindrales bacterium]
MPLAGTLGATVTVRGTTRLRGRLRPPPDKSISHRALLLAALAEGESHIEGGSAALDPASTAACLRTLGVEIEASPMDERRVDWLVRSPGPLGWRQPPDVLDCGNSGTTLRLLAGMLAGVPLRVVLDGDASLRGRPVARIIEPLRAMGATLSARANDALPPLSVVGRRPLRAIEHRSAVPSAQVKSAVLLAGLAAEGTTQVREPVATRDHTERMLRARGVTVTSQDEPEGGVVVSLEGGSPVLPLAETIPGDLSAAAFWLV